MDRLRLADHGDSVLLRPTYRYRARRLSAHLIMLSVFLCFRSQDHHSLIHKPAASPTLTRLSRNNISYCFSL